MVKIRLQRHGKKSAAFYKIVVANSVDKRNGRFIENIGTYNPNTNPATIVLNLDSAVNWLEKGAQPTLTAGRILSYKGALLKKHLNGGVRKGAFSQEVADERFAQWMKEKEAKVSGKVDTLSKTVADKKAEALKAEAEINAKKAEALAAKIAAAEAAKAAAEAPAEQAVPATEEAPATEEQAAE
ncbi:MAG: 30S ribosomal protein S16 [Flavobacteriales bacterium]|nr:30S ribosomal protein S16 [Flavobacteriales bacterium]